jgi:hypothetical protein
MNQYHLYVLQGDKLKPHHHLVFSIKSKMCVNVNNFVASMIKASNLVLVEEQIAFRSLVDSIFGMHDFL